MNKDTIVRVKVALFMLAVLLIAGCIAIQSRWDASCATQVPGSHWNGDDWICEGGRS